VTVRKREQPGARPAALARKLGLALVAFLAGSALLPLGGCNRAGRITCKTKLTAGTGSFVGTAEGPAETQALRLSSVREACLQMCASTKEQMLDACASRCAGEVETGKMEADTSCSRW
jgi:hypothetical protein